MMCPASKVNRAEMATFLVLAATPGFTPPPCSVFSFADVNCATDWFAPWVEELYRRGLTGGCASNPLRYCPANQVTRAEISAFLLRAREGTSYQPPAAACPTPWADVPCGHWAASWMAEASRQGIVTGCAAGFCPDQPFTRAQMAGYLDRGFDLPVAIDPKAPRNATFAYNQGLLTGVSANGVSYGTLSYHSNLLVSQVTHGNGVMETQGNDPNQMRRPASLSAVGPYAAWSSGAYAYDGAGNVKTIGTSTFTYDKVNRLVSASLFDGPTGSGNLKQQSYTFDPHGNLTAIAGTSGRNIPTNAGTNRLNALGTAYDAAGNLTSWNGAAYEYDRFNQMTHMTSGGEDWFYLYTADDERIWSFSSALSRWTLRDLGGKVLREYLTDSRGWSVGTDYLYRDGLLLAAETQTGRRHFHLDHLGTPRLITRASGDRASYHVYYPFGEEATAFNQDSERMKFTGHERDLGSLAGAGDDLDYMHQRFCSPLTGRFLSADVAPGKSKMPQSWNRYSYAQGNPIRYVDPDGQDIRDVVEGFMNALGSDLALGLGRAEPRNEDFAFGQKGGDVAASAGALIELTNGFTLSGSAAVVTVGSAGTASPVTIPVAAVGATLLAHGSAVVSTSVGNLMEGTGPGASERNPAQDKLLSKGEIKKLEKAGFDVHNELKGGKSTGKLDIYKDVHGNLYLKSKGGSGAGSALGININKLPSRK